MSAVGEEAYDRGWPVPHGAAPGHVSQAHGLPSPGTALAVCQLLSVQEVFILKVTMYIESELLGHTIQVISRRVLIWRAVWSTQVIR